MKHNTSNPKPTNPQKKPPRHEINLNLTHKNKKNHENTVSTMGSQSMDDRKKIKIKSNRNMVKKDHKKTQTTTARTNVRSSIENGNRFNLPLKQNAYDVCMQQQNISYREYCIIGNKWIPLLTNSQRERIVNPLPLKSFELAFPAKQSQHTTTPNIETLQQTISKLNEQLRRDINFEEISQQTKDYYRNILRNIMERLQINQINIQQKFKEHQQNQKCTTGKFGGQKYEDREIDTIVNSQSEKNQDSFEESTSPIKQLRIQTVMVPENDHKNTYNLIKMREFKQLSLLPIQTQQIECSQIDSVETVNTSILCVQKYIQKILSTIQNSNLCTQIANHLKTAWGCPRKEKLTRLRNGRYLGSVTEVLPEYLFELIESNYGSMNINEFIHNRSLFDCINFELNKLKPFYETNGQGFPWNFKLFASTLTFYDIQQDSLPFAFEEIKMKVIQYSQFLCGIIVDIPKNDPQFEIVMKRRMEREDNMMRKYINAQEQKITEQNAIQNEATLSLLKISNEIFESLLEEIMDLIHI